MSIHQALAAPPLEARAPTLHREVVHCGNRCQRTYACMLTAELSGSNKGLHLVKHFTTAAPHFAPIVARDPNRTRRVAAIWRLASKVKLHGGALAYAKAMLDPFGQDLYAADGPPVSFYGFPYPTRMAVARLSTGKLWVWSPIALTTELMAEVEAIGPVGYIVSPNKLHHLFLADWARRWPAARLYAPPGLARRKKQLHFDAVLGDQPEGGWIADIDQAVFGGSIAMDEVVFFHRPSGSAIFGDLIQRFPEEGAKGWKGALMRLDGLVGPGGSTPREWRLSFLSHKVARAALQKTLGWRPRRLLIAHGECAA